jgi:hypothetical protein
MMQSSNGGSGSFLCLYSCHYYLVVAFTPFTKLDCFPLSFGRTPVLVSTVVIARSQGLFRGSRSSQLGRILLLDPPNW